MLGVRVGVKEKTESVASCSQLNFGLSFCVFHVDFVHLLVEFQQHVHVHYMCMNSRNHKHVLCESLLHRILSEHKIMIRAPFDLEPIILAILIIIIMMTVVMMMMVI